MWVHDNRIDQNRITVCELVTVHDKVIGYHKVKVWAHEMHLAEQHGPQGIYGNGDTPLFTGMILFMFMCCGRGRNRPVGCGGITGRSINDWMWHVLWRRGVLVWRGWKTTLFTAWFLLFHNLPLGLIWVVSQVFVFEWYLFSFCADFLDYWLQVETHNFYPLSY